MGFNPLQYASLPGYSYECWLETSGFSLNNMQDKQMLDGFIEAKMEIQYIG